MSEKQFDIFDDHFKDAAEHYEPEFSEAAWQKMQAKLDQKDKNRRRMGWWWVSDAIMVSLLLYLAITINNKDFVNNLSKNKQEQPEKTATGNDQKIDQQDNDKKKNNYAPTSKSVAPDTNPDVDKTAGNNQSVFANIKTGAAKKTNWPDGSITGRNTNSKNDDIGRAAAEQKKAGLNGDANANSAGPNISSTIIIPKAGNNIAKMPAENKTAADNQATVLQKSVLKTDSVALASINKPNTSNAKNNISFKKHFFLHAGYAPEKSYVKGNDPGPLSYAYGGGIGFSFAKRWSLLTGIYATKKDYTASGEDYHPGYNSYYYNLKIYSVEAYCNITEIPLSVNYAVLQKSKHSIIAGAGFASLIMKKEWYDYHYERANGMYGHADHTYKTNNVHLFAAAMLNAGYQFNINKRLSVSASPYVKIPLYGVGEGKVKITSAGILTGIIYKLPDLDKNKH
jgi:hypothetical protein